MAVSKTKRDLERSYWIAVMKTVDFDEDFVISLLVDRRLTRKILISKQCYSEHYNQMVRYASFSFFKSIPKSYFGRDFAMKHDLIPILNVDNWLKKRQDVYHQLIAELGKDFEYESECKRVNILGKKKKKFYLISDC